ncbi:MAG TPA: hypothetical protein VLB29_19230 [Nocardioidaceae bacterium]|nr:hypothetical protein [Nocardioidaceae bacterium]
MELEDTEQTDEIVLLAELMVLASESPGGLDLPTIDATLGIRPWPELPEQRRAS